jgi:hypothetical protein
MMVLYSLLPIASLVLTIVYLIGMVLITKCAFVKDMKCDDMSEIEKNIVKVVPGLYWAMLLLPIVLLLLAAVFGSLGFGLKKMYKMVK